MMDGFKEELSLELALFTKDTSGDPSADHQVARLVEMARPSTAVFHGLVHDGQALSEPTDAPCVGNFLPPILVQYLAWQRLCEISNSPKDHDTCFDLNATRSLR